MLLKANKLSTVNNMASVKTEFLFITVALTVFIVYCQADDPMKSNFIQGASKDDFDKCLTEAGLTKDDLKGPPKEPTGKELCLAKCMTIAGGGLDKNGMIVADVIKKNAPAIYDADTVNNAIKCMQAAGKIDTCDDFSKIVKCSPKPPA